MVETGPPGGPEEIVDHEQTPPHGIDRNIASGSTVLRRDVETGLKGISISIEGDGITIMPTRENLTEAAYVEAASGAAFQEVRTAQGIKNITLDLRYVQTLNSMAIGLFIAKLLKEVGRTGKTLRIENANPGPYEILRIIRFTSVIETSETPKDLLESMRRAKGGEDCLEPQG